MPEWSDTNPMRVVTGYHNIARRFFEEQGFEHVVLLSADGALEAAPLMGSADIILDLVSCSRLAMLQLPWAFTACFIRNVREKRGLTANHGLQISTGVTLRENNLKEIECGKILESEGVLVANRRALKRDPRLMKVVHELIERFEVRLQSVLRIFRHCMLLQLFICFGCIIFPNAWA